MKRKIGFVLLALVMLCMSSLQVQAAGTIHVTASGKITNQTVTLTLDVDQSSIYSGQILVGYNTDQLTLKKVETKEAMSDVLVDVNQDYKDEKYLVSLVFAGAEPVKAGTMMELTFESKGEIPSDGFTFDFKVNELNGSDATSILSEVTNESFTIVVEKTETPIDPVQTETPTPTKGPEATKEPTTTEEPTTTKEPSSTKEPIQSEKPEGTKTPEETKKPVSDPEDDNLPKTGQMGTLFLLYGSVITLVVFTGTVIVKKRGTIRKK